MRFKHCANITFCIAHCLFSNVLADTGSANAAPSYHWGRGLDLPISHLNIGGYFNATFENIKSDDSKASLEDLSFFISASPFDRLRFFSELEVEDLLATDKENNFSGTLLVERLYIDYLASDSATLRFGKFLTPVGRWNVTHASPLVWTTTLPLLAADQMFSSHASGLMLSKRFELNEHDLDVSVYADDSADLDIKRDQQFDFDNAYGMRLNATVLDQFEIGTSYVGFNRRSEVETTRNHLFGLDMSWKSRGYELQMEMAYRHADDFQGDEKGFYLQGVAPFSQQLFAVGRYEYLDGTHQIDIQRTSKSTTHIGVVGLTWRPYIPLAIKSEYRFGADNQLIAPSGFFASISMFF